MTFLSDLAGGDGTEILYQEPTLSAGGMSGYAPQLADSPAPQLAMPFSPEPSLSLVLDRDGVSIYAIQHGRKFGLPDPDTFTHTFQPLLPQGWSGPSVWTLLNKSATARAILDTLPERPWSEFQPSRWIQDFEQALLPDGVGAPIAQVNGMLPLSATTVPEVLYGQRPAEAMPINSAILTTVVPPEPRVPRGSVFGFPPAIVEPEPLAPIRDTVSEPAAPLAIGKLLLPIAAAALAFFG